MRQGRPRKEWTNKDIEKMEITDDVISQLKYNAGLSPEQVETLKKTLDDTLKQYNLEKEVVKDEDKSIKDINAEALEDFFCAACSWGATGSWFASGASVAFGGSTSCFCLSSADVVGTVFSTALGVGAAPSGAGRR